MPRKERGRQPGSPEPAPETIDQTRRVALEAMSRYAAYTAPAILSLLAAGDAAARSGPRLSVACPAGNPDTPPQCG